MSERASTTGTETRAPASWEHWPDYEEAWNAYCDILWGTGGDSSLHDMMVEDLEHLKKVYLQNNETLTNMENDYINDTKRADYAFEEEVRGAQIPLKFGGGPTINLLPKSSKYIAEKTRAHKTDTLAQGLALGDRQAGRIMEYGKEFTPNRAEIAHMEYLKQLGSRGQDLRMGLPTTTATGEVEGDRGTIGTVGDYASIGANVAKAGSDSGFWGWLSDSNIDWTPWN